LKPATPDSEPDFSLPGTNDRRRAQRFMVFLVGSLIMLGLALAFYRSLLVPLAVSALFTYLLLPLTNRLERFGWTRVGSVAVIVAVFLGTLGIAVARLVPVLYAQGQLLLHLVPGAFSSVLDRWIPLLDSAIAELGFKAPKSLRAYVSEYNVFGALETPFQQGLAGIWVTGSTLFGGIVNALLIPLVTFFLLKDFPALAAGLRALVPVDLRAPFAVVGQRINETLRSVIKGQVTVAAILTVLYVIGFSIVGLQSAVAIGVVAGVCRIVPYLDVIVGGTLSTIVLLSDFPGWGRVFGVFLVFMVVQGLDGALITPRVIGDRVGLHPVVVILSVLAFANWLGFWGVLIAIPIVAVAKALIAAALPFYQASKTFNPPWYTDGH
jgi:predicted PurR-regulated permease PerM